MKQTLHFFPPVVLALESDMPLPGRRGSPVLSEGSLWTGKSGAAATSQLCPEQGIPLSCLILRTWVTLVSQQLSFKELKGVGLIKHY